MSLAVTNWFRRGTRPASRGPREARETCAGCGSPRAEFRRAGLFDDGGPCVCPSCGALADGAGQPLVVDPATGRLVPGGAEGPGADAASPPSAEDRAAAAERVRRHLADGKAAYASGELGGYLARVVEQAGGDPAAPVLLLDEGEPLSMPLPAGGVLLSLGLLASLHDEAQLAFVLAREQALARAGWADRRFGAVAAGTPRWLAALRPGRADDQLDGAIALSLRVGWGPEAERDADAHAIAAMRRGGYDVAGAVRGLFVLEASSLPGRGVRFMLDDVRRGRLLVEASRPAAPGRVDREVYRRAIGGYAVFSVVRRG